MKKRILMLVLLCLITSLITTIILVENDKSNQNIPAELIPLNNALCVIDETEKEMVVVKQQPTIEEIAAQEYITKMEELKTTEDKMQWFIEYKELIFKYYEHLDPPETVFDVFSEEEIQLIFRVVETETYDQDFDLKCNVASVVLNRYYDGRFGDTITEVITTENQFAYGRKSITEDTIYAVMYSFEVQDTTDGCLAFRSGKHPEIWKISDTFVAELQFVDDAGHGLYKEMEE